MNFLIINGIPQHPKERESFIRDHTTVQIAKLMMNIVLQEQANEEIGKTNLQIIGIQIQEIRTCPR